MENCCIFVSLKNNTNIAELSKDELIVEVMQLQHRLSLLEKMIFGPKHERFIPSIPIAENQLALGIAVETLAEPEVKIIPVPAHERKQADKKTKIHPGRNPLPASLRREEIVLEPLEEVTDCVRIGEEITEVLEVKAAEFYVKRFVRPKVRTQK